MRSSATLLALGAWNLGETLAGPAHAHLHRGAHAKKDLSDVTQDDWNKIDWKNLVNWEDVKYGNPGASSPSPAVVAPAAPSEDASDSPAAAASDILSSAPSSDSATSETFTGLFEDLWNNLEGVSNSRTSFGSRTASGGGEEWHYRGNCGDPYGSNLMIVDSIDDYDYTIKFKNVASYAMTINVWNKIGSDGGTNSGATAAPKDTTLTFNLSPGQSAIVAADEDTQLAFCEAVDRFHGSGAYEAVFGEVKMAKGDSGFDYSAILNTGPQYHMVMSAEETDCVSSHNENNWVTETQTTGSGSCYIPADGAHLTVEMGGTRK